MITLRQVSCVFFSRQQTFYALTDIDLTLPKGQIFGIIGKSGAGKSTLLRCMNLLERPTRGEVWFDGVPLTSLDEKSLRRERRKMGMIFQHFNLLSSASVFQNVAFPLEISGVRKNEIRERVLSLLAVTGLSEKQHSYPAQLSGGQKQRVAIARALASQPKILLCDEATSALDPETTQSILSLLKEINRAFGLTIVLITHEMDVVKTLCDRVAVLHQGHIVEQSSVTDLFSNPKTSTAKSLLQSLFRVSLPEQIQSRLVPEFEPGASVVLRCSAFGEKALSILHAGEFQRFSLTAHLLQAQVESLGESPFGTFVFHVLGEPERFAKAVEFLVDHHISCEVVGHVRSHSR